MKVSSRGYREHVGFTGSVDESEWAVLSSGLGAALPVVLGRYDYAVTINTGGGLGVNVAPGGAIAAGVGAYESDITSVVSRHGRD